MDINERVSRLRGTVADAEAGLQDLTTYEAWAQRTNILLRGHVSEIRACAPDLMDDIARLSGIYQRLLASD